MTETSIFPGATPVSDAGMDMMPPTNDHDDSEGGGNRRNLMIIGAVAGVIIVLAAAYMLLHKSPSSTPQLARPPATAPVKPVTTTHTGASKGSTKGSSNGKGASHGKGTTLPKVAKQPTVRDPFKPLVTAPVTTGGAASSTTTVTPTTTTTTNPNSGIPVTTTTTPPVTTPPSTTTTPGTGGKTVGPPLSIQLMSTNGQKATFKVVYAQHKFRRFIVQAPSATSDTGTVFDKVFALIGVQNGQATIQVGDDTPFDLATGVSHVV